MSQKYCTFWYPTIYHQELCSQLNKNRILTLDISDPEDENHPKYIINIQLRNENLIITSKVKDISFDVELVHTEEKKNGFVQYRYSTENIPPDHLNEFETVLKKDIYHLAKQFYHKHDVDSGKDSALRAIITDKQESIGTEDNTFIVKPS